MKQGIRSSGEMPSRRLVRWAALATLLGFLVGQSSMLCVPLCLLQGHAVMTMTSTDASHGLPCHSGKVIVSPPAVAGSLVTTIPSQATPLLPSLRLIDVPFASPPPGQLRQLPPQDPPPPRSI
jgi:hypothetical protein